MKHILLTCGIMLSGTVFAAPANDNFADATPISGLLGSSATNNTASATAEIDEPAHAGFAPSHSVWWKYTAPTNGILVVDTLQSDIEFDTILGVYTGTALSNLAEIASNDDDDNEGNRSKVIFEVILNETYWIAVDGYDDDSVGDAVLNWELLQGEAPANDTFADAAPISGYSGTSAVIDTTSATAEITEPAHAGQGAYHSVWWKYTAPTNGIVELDTLQSNQGFDTLLGIYTGSSLGSLIEVAFNDDNDDNGNRSKAILTVDAETTYWIAVDGYGGATGDAVLNWKLSTYDDDDGDGVDNADEVIADTNPSDSNAWFHITGIVSNTVYFDSSSSREYTLYWSTNLSEDVWTPVAPARRGDGGSDSLSSTNSYSAEFYKVEVGLPAESGGSIDQ